MTSKGEEEEEEGEEEIEEEEGEWGGGEEDAGKAVCTWCLFWEVTADKW